MPLLRLILLASFCVITFAGGTANAANADSATPDKELRRAEAVVAKLRRLEAATAAEDPNAYRKAAEKSYPGLFISAADLLDGNVKTDISTAAALYESAYRSGATTGAAAPDCSRELRASYFQLCSASNSRTRLLWAKAQMHTRFAEAAILYARGDRTSTTLDTLAQLRAERASDVSLAEEALRALKELAVEMASGSTKRLSERDTATLGEVESILASLPRGNLHLLLRNARDAFRDRNFWQLKAAPARALVVSANSLAAPDPLRQLNLSADDADRAALQNWQGALKYIGKAEAAIGEAREPK